jgi:hypothetical protein
MDENLFNVITSQKEVSISQVWRFTPVIPATQEAETGGSRLEARPGRVSKTLSGKERKKKKN